MKCLLLVLLLLGTAHAVVQFSNSALYDVYDFVGVDEVPLPLCEQRGCWIYASTAKSTNPITHLDLYADSLVISLDGSHSGDTIARVALRFDDATTKKIPLIPGPGTKVSILNQNIEHDRFNSIVVYVVAADTAVSLDFDIYDSHNMNMAIVPPANITTIMSAVPFTITAKGDKGYKNIATTRLVGPDNALDNNVDECPIAFQTAAFSDLYNKMEISATVPIVSVTFSEQYRVQVGATTQFYNNVEFYNDGFISSAGWNGCRKPNAGGCQSFRSPAYITSNAYMIMTNDDYFSVHLEAEMHTDENHTLLVRDLTNWQDVNWYGSYEQGTANKELTIDKTYFCEFKSREMEGDQGFIVRHYGKRVIEGGETTLVSPGTTPQSTADSGPYCKCDLDKFDMPLNWKSTDIWVDVVIVLDTSEALSEKALQESASFIESLLGDEYADVLTTDRTAKFYTRVGVIAMANQAQVLYDLNMTKADSVRDKVSVTKGLAEIDIGAAFTAAQQMFITGVINEPKRATTRQIVHFITNSAPTSSNVFTDFTAAGGTIIVNNILPAVSEQPKDSLKSLASPGYFFVGVSDYMDNVQALCKANCFCGAGLTPFAESSDPAARADGGCYSVSAAGVSYSKAKQTCTDNRGGIIATVHDDKKGPFLNQLIASVSSRQFFFWIGYTKGDDDQWRWEDGSTDAYTNWAKDEPSSSAVSRCAYADQSYSNLSWGAGNCQMGLPYACEYAPCSAGNNNCLSAFP